jgi:hypothetical protein
MSKTAIDLDGHPVEYRIRGLTLQRRLPIDTFGIVGSFCSVKGSDFLSMSPSELRVIADLIETNLSSTKESTGE